MLTRLVLTALVLVAAGAHAGDTANPATPCEGVQRVELRELWRVGDDDDTIFGLVPSVGVDGAGNVHVLDSQMCQVAVFDREGELRRFLFREGEGPGEVREPRDMVVMDDGRVGLLQEFPGAIVFVDAAGDPAGRLEITAEGGFVSLTAAAARGDELLVSGTVSTEGPRPEVRLRENFVGIVDATGRVTHRLATNRCQYDFSDLVFSEKDHLPPFWWAFDVCADGRIAVVPRRDDYTIATFTPDGEPAATITRANETLPRTDLAYDRLRGMIASAFSASPIKPTIEVERTEGALAAMHRPLQARDDGTLWVLPSRGVRPGEPGVMATFDVFDAGGAFVKQVQLAAPHDGTKVGIFFAGEDRVLVVRSYFESLAAQFGNGATFTVEGEEQETPAVICYEMVR